MRILLYGMQSSGASAVAYLLAQIPRSLAVIDVWNNVPAPPLSDLTSRVETVIAKCVITTKFDLDEHIDRFRPDRTILLLRHPAHNYVSLQRKRHRESGGALDRKFVRLEECFRSRDAFDQILIYEQFVLRPTVTIAKLGQIGIDVGLRHLSFDRSLTDIRDFNAEQSAWCARYFEEKWGFGQIHEGRIDPKMAFKHVSSETRSRVRALCPETFDFMTDFYRKRVPLTTRFQGSVWNDVVLRRTKQIRSSVLPRGDRTRLACWTTPFVQR